MKKQTSKTVPIKFATLGHAAIVQLAVKRAKSKGPRVWFALEFDEKTKGLIDAKVEDWREAHSLTSAQARDAYFTHLAFCDLATAERQAQELKALKKPCVSVGPDGSSVTMKGDGYVEVRGPLATKVKILASARGVKSEKILEAAISERVASLQGRRA